jgi:multiple sugar transport system substrate-binding protein
MIDQNISRRRFLKAGAVSVSALGLAACARDINAPADGGSGDGQGSLRVADPSYQQPTYKSAMDAVTAAFQKANGGTKVEQVAPPFAQYSSTVLTQLQAGSPPDVIRIDDPQLATYVDRGWLLPLGDILDTAGVTVEELAPAQRDAVVGGQVYGVVKESNPRAFIYNKDLYARAGVQVPTDVASLEEVLRKTTDPGQGRFGVGLASKEGDATGLFIQLMPFVLGFGGQFFNGREPTATAAKTIESLEFVKMLWDDNLVPRSLDAVTVNNLMAQGKVATMISGAFIIGLAKESNPKVGAELTIADNPLPSGITMRATAWWGVPAKARNPELGKKYLQALLQPEVQQQFQKATGVLTARRDSVTQAYLADNPWFSTIVEIGNADT